MDVDAGVGVAERRRQIDNVPADSHCVVVEHSAPVLETKELIQAVTGAKSDPCFLRLLRADHKASVVAWAERGEGPGWLPQNWGARPGQPAWPAGPQGAPHGAA